MLPFRIPAPPARIANASSPVSFTRSDAGTFLSSGLSAASPEAFSQGDDDDDDDDDDAKEAIGAVKALRSAPLLLGLVVSAMLLVFCLCCVPHRFSLLRQVVRRAQGLPFSLPFFLCAWAVVAVVP